MKLHELKQDEPLKVISVSQHLERPTIVNKPLTPSFVELDSIQMKIFTDGQIENESEEISESIEEYYIGKKKYPHHVDTLKTKNIFLKDYSFAIVYLIASEYMVVGNIRGWFDVVKDVSVYVKDLKDRKTLKKAKQVIRQIANRNNSVDYSSLFGMYASCQTGSEGLELDKISNNVYTLRKKI